MLPQQTLHHIERALRGLTYGSLQLIVHDGQIVRIERVERTRLTVTSEATLIPLGPPTPSTEVCHEPQEP